MADVNRRILLTSLACLLGGALTVSWSDAEGGQRRARVRHRRRVRRRVRRRIRRRVVTRVVLGRHVWVAPVALAIGWELALSSDRIVVVKETKVVERAGAKVEVVVVQGSDGKTEELEIVREDTPENAKSLQGTVLADDDKTTPSVETEEEVEVDE